MAAALVVAVAGLLGGTGSGPQAAEGRSKPSALVVSPSGSDAGCARGNPSRPCATFGGAYAKARCGDTVEVRGGSYPSQRIVEVPRLSRCRTNVTLVAARGAGVNVNGSISLGDNNAGGFDTNAPDRLTLKGFTYTEEIVMWGDADRVIVDGVRGGSVLIQGATNITVRNSEFGPCPSHPETCGRFFILDGSHDGEPRTTNVLIENNVIHDFPITRADDHWECIFATGGANVTIRGNSIYNCDTYDIVLGDNRYSAGFSNWVIEHNRFGDTCCFGGLRTTGGRSRSSAVNLYAVTDTVIRSNSFEQGQKVTNEGGGTVSGVRVVGNILGASGCADGARYSGNLFIQGRCAQDDRNGVYGYRFDGVRLRLEPKESGAIRLAYESVQAGKSARATARLLARKGFPRPSGGWNATTLRQLLQDDVYLGRRLGRPSDHARLVTPKRWRAVKRALDLAS